MSDSSPEDILIEVEVPATQDQVWAAVASATELSSWLAEDARVGTAVGEPFELFWDPGNREVNSTIGCRIVEWEEPTRLTIEWKGPVQFASIMNGSPVPTWVSVDLRAGSGNSTILRLRHGGWRSGETWLQARAWHETVWGNALNQLRLHVGGSA
ncbi:SRPBCC family protein [Amycolatopsis nivea]